MFMCFSNIRFYGNLKKISQIYTFFVTSQHFPHKLTQQSPSQPFAPPPPFLKLSPLTSQNAAHILE